MNFNHRGSPRHVMSNDAKHQPTCRPLMHLVQVAKRYPGAWKQVDAFRAIKGTELPDWPDYVFLPLAGAYAIVGRGGRVPLSRVHDIAIVGALAAWRVTQGIYAFDPTLYQEVITTTIPGELPTEVLRRLPEWCVYVETPELALASEEKVHGFFAHLELDVNEGHEELRFLVDCDTGLHPFIIHLGPWSVARGLTETLREGAHHAGLLDIFESIPDEALSSAMRCDAGLLETMTSLLLYLCTVNADLGPGCVRPEAKRTKHGPRWFAPDQPRRWPVGVRLGAALRAAAQRDAQTGNERGAHASPRPPIRRRAHWQSYWTGPKDSSERRIVLEWQPPFAVNVGDYDDLTATVRPVPSDSRNSSA